MTGRRTALTAHALEGAGPFPAGTAPTVVGTAPTVVDAAVTRPAVRVEQLGAAALLTGAIALPLVMNPSAGDVFALPKAMLIAVLTVVLVGCLAVLRWRHCPAACLRSPAVVDVVVVYLTLTVAATIRSPDPLHSVIGEPLQLQGTLASLCYVVGLLAAGRVLVTEFRIRRLMGAVAAAVSVVVAYGVAQQANLDPIWDVLNRGRIFSTLGQANNLAAYLVIALPLVLGLAFTARTRPPRIVFIVLGGAIVATLGLTLSRGGYLGAAATLATFAILTLRRPALTLRRPTVTRRRIGAFGMVAAVVVLLGLTPPVADSAGRILDRARQVADGETGSGALHLDLWAVGVRMTVDHPLLGVGPEMYPAAFSQYRDAVLPAERAAIVARFRPESPHSVPIAIAAGAGVPALAAYLTVIGLALVAGLRRWRRAAPRDRILVAGLIAAVIGHLVTDLFMTAEVSTSWLFWVLLGTLATVPRLSSPTARA